jgi:hypothetical protein
MWEPGFLIQYSDYITSWTTAIRFQAMVRILVTASIDRVWGTQSPILWVKGNLSTKVKRPQHEFSHLLHIMPRLRMRGVESPPDNTSSLNKEFLTLVVSLFLTAVRYLGKLLNCSSCPCLTLLWIRWPSVHSYYELPTRGHKRKRGFEGQAVLIATWPYFSGYFAVGTVLQVL